MNCIRCKIPLPVDEDITLPTELGPVKPFVLRLKEGTTNDLEAICLDCVLWRERHMLMFVKEPPKP